MEAIRQSKRTPFSCIDKGSPFEHGNEVYMKLERDHMELNTGVVINAVNLERGVLKHFDESEIVNDCKAQILVME